MTKTITVKGVGNVSVKPDLIVVSMKLATEDREYDKTMELAAQRISLINDSLETIGFEKNSVKTTDFNVRTNYESVKDKSGNYNADCSEITDNKLRRIIQEVQIKKDHTIVIELKNGMLLEEAL